MMTRSYTVISVSLRVSHPHDIDVTDVVYLKEDFRFSESEIHQLAMNEVNAHCLITFQEETSL